MASPLSSERLAHVSAKNPKRVVFAWIIGLVVAIFLAGTLLGDVLTTEFNFTGNPDSKVGDELLEDRLRGERHAAEAIIVQSASLTIDDPQFRTFVEGLTSDLEALRGEDGGDSAIIAESLSNFYRTGAPSMVSEDRRSTIISLEMTGALDDADDNIEAVLDVGDAAEAGSGGEFNVLQVGFASIGFESNKQSEEDLIKGETFGVTIALVILILVFGALVAALVPIIIAVLSIAIAIGLAALVGQLGDLSFFITNMITMIGLAVGIDYSLFIVQRYREERSKGLDKLAAIDKAGATASRAVFFSGITVVLALIGMLLVPSTIFVALGLGAILVVLVSLAASLTLVPAILSILGDRINKGRIPLVTKAQDTYDEQQTGGFWDKITHAVMARPLISLILTAGLLIAAAIPFFDIDTGFAGPETFPDSLQSKAAFLALQEDFTVGEVSPVEIVIDGSVDSPQTGTAIARLTDILAGDADFGPPDDLVVNPARDLALYAVPVNGDTAGPVAQDAIERLRDDYIPSAFGGAPVEVFVTGDAAFNKDFFDSTRSAAPVVFIFVLSLSFALLTIVFRSIVVAIKSIILNLLSVGAAYGILVMVFQKGWGNELFGFQQVATIESWIPLFLFSVLFGLSMDYHVFLLSRIRERYDITKDNKESVAFGVRSTARLITGAALIMVAVFGGFASGELVGLSQMGFGLGVAVLLDATIVRMILVPSAMAILGNANWYLPSWLNWLPDLRVDVSDQPAPSHAVSGADDEPKE